MSEPKTDSTEEFGFSNRQVWWIGRVSRGSVALMILVCLLMVPAWLLGFFPSLSIYYAIGGGCLGLAGIGGIGYFRETLIPYQFEQQAKRVSDYLYWVGIGLVSYGLILTAF